MRETLRRSFFFLSSLVVLAGCTSESTSAVSASHIAFGSVRMEPVFMILGQSAATAAVMSIDRDVSVQ
jgi:hypothetical protein